MITPCRAKAKSTWPMGPLLAELQLASDLLDKARLSAADVAPTCEGRRAQPHGLLVEAGLPTWLNVFFQVERQEAGGLCTVRNTVSQQLGVPKPAARPETLARTPWPRGPALRGGAFSLAPTEFGRAFRLSFLRAVTVALAIQHRVNGMPPALSKVELLNPIAWV